MEFELRDDGRFYAVSPPMGTREAFDENRPLPDLALYVLGWTNEDIERATRAHRPD